MSCLKEAGSGTADAGFSIEMILGIALGLSASIGINVGNNVQALGLQQAAEAGSEKKNKTFWTGCTIFGIASVINFGAFGFAPAAVLAPLEGIQFVSNLAFARLVNKKAVSFRMYLGSAMCVGGIVLAIINAPSGVAKFSADDLICFWKSTTWLLFLGAVAVIGVSLQLLHIYYQRELDAGRPKCKSSVVLPVTFAVTSALAGSQAVVQAKSMSELVELVFTDDDTMYLGVPGLLQTWMFYFCLALLMVFLITWLTRMSQALGKYDPLFIIPLLQANYILFSCVTGGIYFQEFNSLSAQGAALFTLGVAIMMWGLYMLAPPSDNKGDQGETDKKAEAARQATMKQIINESNCIGGLQSITSDVGSSASVTPRELLPAGGITSDAPQPVDGGAKRESVGMSSKRGSVDGGRSRAESAARIAVDAAGLAARVRAVSTSVVNAPDEDGVPWPLPAPVVLGAEIVKTLSFRSSVSASRRSSMGMGRFATSPSITSPAPGAQGNLPTMPSFPPGGHRSAIKEESTMEGRMEGSLDLEGGSTKSSASRRGDDGNPTPRAVSRRL